MTDPYVSIDTFSVGFEPNDTEEALGPAPSGGSETPVIARLPRVAPAAPAKSATHRYDTAETALHGVHVDDSPLATTAPPASAGLAEQAPIQVSDPAVTIRIDTVTPDAFEVSKEEALLRKQANEALLGGTEPDTAIEDPWASSLLSLEAAILPYSRWIVLAAVIAALGLTLVLLQTAGRRPLDAGTALPQVQLGQYDPAYVTAEAAPQPTPAAGEAPSWGTLPDEAAVANAWDASEGLRPLDRENETTEVAPPLVAAGPASVAPRNARATLLGQVLPPDADPSVEVATATRPDYPRTATAPRDPQNGSFPR